MSESLTDATADILRRVSPKPTVIQQEMAAFADEEGFPIVGPEAGGVLRVLARLVGARTVFEFGSGFGYSATWFAQALPSTGQLVLTEIDSDELALAREYLDRSGDADRAVFEHGDALDIVSAYDGPFDVILIDIRNQDYVEAFEAARGRVRPGGIIIADNMLAGPFGPETILAGLRDKSSLTEQSPQGVVAYINRVLADEAFDTTLLPVGKGLAISSRLT